jgi:uncharacterized protein YigA (DUF484 family)
MNEPINEATNKVVNTIKKQDIIEYLESHPGFFQEQPELLQELQVPDEQGQLQQMATYQAKTLQAQNKQLKNKIKQLIHHAKINETLMNRIYHLLAELATVERSQFLPRYVDFVKKQFACEHFKLSCQARFIKQQPSKDLEPITAAQKSQFTVFQSKDEPLSGRLPQSQIEAMFGANKDIKSAIIIPLGPQASYGLMGFASSDEDKFHPHLASDILQKLGNILSQFLTAMDADEPNQAQS